MTGPRVISGFGDLRYADGGFRTDGPHNGIDLAWAPGYPVIAAADGDIVVLRENDGLCGNLIIIQHTAEYRSVYCHVDVPFKKPYGAVKRGEVIADLAYTTRQGGNQHLHYSLRTYGQNIDPLKMIVGCFDPKRTYPDDPFSPTYPVPCKD